MINENKKFGRSSWELDALQPTMLRELISTEINGLLDLDAFTDSIKTELRFVKRLEEVAETFAQE